MVRSSDGKLRFDSGDMSVITDPAKQQTIILDHLNKEARVCAMPQVPAAQFSPGGVTAAAGSPLRLVNVQDLGKSIIEGHEVVGKRYSFQPPEAPGVPAVPQPPALPQVQAPQLPQSPLTTSEVWTSTKLQLPVLTKTTGSFGEQIRRCRYIESGEPAASLFQAPPDYQPPATPAPPAPPNVPG